MSALKTRSALASSALAVALVTLAVARDREPGAPAAAVKPKAKGQCIVLKDGEEFHVHLIVENMGDGDVPTKDQVRLKNDWFATIDVLDRPKPYKQNSVNKGLIIRGKPRGKRAALPQPAKVPPGQGPQQKDGDNLTVTVTTFDPTDTLVPAVVSD
jgi:hypothetical protein